MPPLPLVPASARRTLPASSVVAFEFAMLASPPCQPPPTSTVPPPCAPLASTTAPERTVTSSAVMRTEPPASPLVARTSPPTSADLAALRTTAPPSTETPVACTRPLCLSCPAKMPTASPCSVPRFTASLPACTSKTMPSRPRPVSSTFWPAARIVAPLGACTSACGPTATCGAISTTSPLLAMILPLTVKPPPPRPSAPNSMRPASASASVIRSVEAVNPLVSTTAPAPTAIPAGLTSTSLPLDDSVPKICEGLLPRTRLIEVLVVEGWSNRMYVPGAMPSVAQLMTDWLVPRPFCVLMTCEAPRWISVAWPCTTSMPVPPA